MNDFNLFFGIGIDHILNTGALDHLLFIMVLCAVYLVTDWKKLLVLITAFTIGHSLTLALSVYDVVRFNSAWVEFLIPLTIVLTALYNLTLAGKAVPRQKIQINYLLALFFGLVHGMGFANNIRFMLAESQSILLPLLGFNLGLELGQIIVVSILLLLSILAIKLMKLQHRYWAMGLSLIGLVAGAIMCAQRIPGM
ncbi:MAG TPA: HupE/UreJ family protein [Ferruginibacter sp.]|nr:HupE/UreJ family protein [Bacteroidota bacterium]MCC6692063.1 HupE/UreJ family protein [Chitinophagaceae bacterium]HMT95400.1 HupE/UreJ family protein [Ferruginibacter sp.]HMU23759.1 HupE/UreJ family protein [Ferruginibacter sp.]